MSALASTLGYGMRLSTSWALILDFLREKALCDDNTLNRFEAGRRFMATPGLLLSVGASAGVEQNSDRARVLPAMQFMLR